MMFRSFRVSFPDVGSPTRPTWPPGRSDLMARLTRRYETHPHGPRQPTEYTLFTATTLFRRHLKMGLTFGLFVLLVTGEWLLRRRWQLS